MRNEYGTWWSGDARPYDIPALRAETARRARMEKNSARITALEGTMAEILGILRGGAPAPTHTEKASATEVVGTPSAPLYVKAYKPVCHTHGCPRPSGKGFTPNGKAYHLRNNPTHDVS